MSKKLQIIDRKTYYYFEPQWEILFIGYHYDPIEKENIIEIKLRRDEEEKKIIWHLPKEK